MSFWDLDSIARSERAAVEARLSRASREELLAEIAALRAAAYPFLATLGGLDIQAPRGVCASSKLFPAQVGKGGDRDRLAVYDGEAGRYRYEPPDARRLHAIEYEEQASLTVLNPEGGPPALHDDVAVLAVQWEGVGGGGPAGEVSMGDVRRLAAAFKGTKA
jgi:hypothetical protein